MSRTARIERVTSESTSAVEPDPRVDGIPSTKGAL